MKVKMLQPARAGNQPTKAGDIREVSDAEGERLIAAGEAEAAPEPPAVTAADETALENKINLKPKTHKMVKADDAE